jgi:hypothetical protein
MTRLSVNINKIATLRNARGGQMPNVVQFAIDCERFGAQGITVHPRPDERHITTQDTYDLAKVVTTEYNIEGYPDARYLTLITDIRPHQATLVPDGPDVLTSNAGWDTEKHQSFLREILHEISSKGVRTSLFVEPNKHWIELAKKAGADAVKFQHYSAGSLVSDYGFKLLIGYYTVDATCLNFIFIASNLKLGTHHQRVGELALARHAVSGNRTTMGRHKVHQTKAERLHTRVRGNLKRAMHRRRRFDERMHCQTWRTGLVNGAHRVFNVRHGFYFGQHHMA